VTSFPLILGRFRTLDQELLRKVRRSLSPGPGGVVSVEPQPLLQCHEAAPKSQWVMVEALWYRRSGWLGGLRLLRGRLEGKGAVDGMSPFPVADSPATTPSVLGSNRLWLWP
jgi:hypothetical protein